MRIRICEDFEGLKLVTDGSNEKNKRYVYDGDIVSDTDINIWLDHPLLINGVLKAKSIIRSVCKITANKIIAPRIVSFNDVSADEIYALCGITCFDLRGYKIKSQRIMASGNIYGCAELMAACGLDSGKSVMADRIISLGDITVDKDISGKIVYSEGCIVANGSVRADELTVAGELTVGEKVFCKKIAFYKPDPMKENVIDNPGLPRWWTEVLESSKNLKAVKKKASKKKAKES